MTSYKIEKHIEIDADKLRVWEILTNPELIKRYLFGTETISEWKVGSEIIFQGDFENMKFRDKGVIKKFDVGKTLQYTYWSGFSGTEDKPENYNLVTYQLNDTNAKTILSLIQENIRSKKSYEHADKSWDFVLAQMKELAEND